MFGEMLPKGSGGGTTIASGSDSLSGTGATKDIDTGLSSITHFVAKGYLTGQETTSDFITVYDSTYTMGAGKKQHCASSYPLTNEYGYKVDDMGTSSPYCLVITNISGGVVSVKSGTYNATWGAMTFNWIAW